MIKGENSRFYPLPYYILYPGEYFATKEECVIRTVTGSCVVVCLHDEKMNIGGVGHFILPGMMGTEGIFRDEIAAYGITSIEFIIGEMVKLGGDRKNIRAKLFGAGFVSVDNPVMKGIVSSNMQFLNEYFFSEKILVLKQDLGENWRREVCFKPHDGSVLRRFLKRNEDASEFLLLEKEYIDRAFRQKEEKTKVVLFE